MRIKITADHDKEVIRDLLAFAARSVGVKHAGITVWVKNSATGTARGRWYESRRHITIGIGPASDFPCPNWRSRQKLIYQDWREAFVDVAAHEFAHALEASADRKAMHGKRPRYRETFANWNGWATLQEYRQQPAGRKRAP